MLLFWIIYYFPGLGDDKDVNKVMLLQRLKQLCVINIILAVQLQTNENMYTIS